MQTYVRRKNREKRVIENDHFIPSNSHKQSRSSSLSKPRSDFSVFLSPPSISHLPDHEEESASSKEKSSTLVESYPDAKIDTKADLLNLPLAQWARSRNKRKIVSLETSTQEVVSVATLESVLPQRQSNVDVQRADVCPTSGSVVWAKKASQMWWPAKVLLLKVLAPNSQTDTGGLVLVHYYGSEKSDWVDPARDLSPFEECFEERSCNPSKEFQEALKQAMHQKKHQSSTRKLIVPAEGHVCLNSTNSSKTEHDCLVIGRSRRRRKPKVHFDEVTIASKSAKDSRRLRIMRSLGLAPPIGSPFA